MSRYIHPALSLFSHRPQTNPPTNPEHHTISPTTTTTTTTMSPFSQLTSVNTGYGGGIDRDFSPILNYIDEFDRHFSRRHRFVNCFIPRFDLEEDSHNYFLYGDIPGATVEDITVEAHDNHTLVIYGKTNRAGPDREGERRQQEERDESGFVKVNVEDKESGENRTSDETTLTYPTPAPAPIPNTTTEGPTSQAPPPNHHDVATHPQGVASHPHPHHQRLPTSGGDGAQSQSLPSHKILLSERLVGDFYRTFAFPAAVEEQGVRASMENGVLSLVVPKKEADTKERDRGKRIPVMHGKWWQSQ